jgi:hypothetical protein
MRCDCDEVARKRTITCGVSRVATRDGRGKCQPLDVTGVDLRFEERC